MNYTLKTNTDRPLMKKWLIFSLFLFLLINIKCKKEFDYPEIQTKEVTNIDSTGAVFNAEILILGNKSIIDCGFVWNIKGNPSFEKSYKKSLGKKESVGIYSSKINSAFEVDSKYYIRAFINNGESIIYGQEKSFISLGSLGPNIVSFLPDTASWGDTIIIKGKNFSSKNEENLVKFGEFSIFPVSSNDTVIFTFVPFRLDKSDVHISVSILGNINNSKEKFQLTAPVINDFNPKSGSYPDIVEITGSYFHPDYTTIKFDSFEANILSVESNKIYAEIPANISSGDVDLSVTVCSSNEVISDKKFFNLSHEISSFSPLSATFGDEIIISGARFSPDISSNIVRFGNDQASVIEITENSLKVLVPYSLPTEFSTISVTVNENTSYASDEFKLKGPTIDNFSPNYGSRGDIIDIFGHNFNTVSDFNKVYIGYKLASVVSSDSNTLSIIVPDNISHGNQELRIVVAGMKFVAPNNFTCYEPWKRLTDFAGGERLSVFGFAIDGKGYFVGGKNDMGNELDDLWMYNPSDNTWTEKANIPREVWGNESFSTTNYGYILFYEELWRYDSNNDVWSRVSDFPGSAEGQRTAFSIGDKGYVGTGYPTTDEFWEYDESSDTWTQKVDYLGGKSRSTTSFSINGKGYISLGWENCTKLWEYDPILDSWRENLDLTGIVQGLSDKRPYSVGLSCDGKGYMISGGYWYNSDQYKDIYQYDPETNICIRMVDMPSSAYKRQQATGFTIGNKMYIGTGMASNHIFLKDFWEFDTSKLKP